MPYLQHALQVYWKHWLQRLGKTEACQQQRPRLPLAPLLLPCCLHTSNQHQITLKIPHIRLTGSIVRIDFRCTRLLCRYD